MKKADNKFKRVIQKKVKNINQRIFVTFVEKESMEKKFFSISSKHMSSILINETKLLVGSTNC